MKNSKLFLIGALSLLMMVSISYSFSQEKGDQRKERTEKRGERKKANIMDRIPDLTEEQRTALEALKMAAQKQVLPVRNQIGEKEAKLKTLTTAEEADMKNIDKLIEDIGDLKTEIAKIRASTHQKIRTELTEDQRLFLDTHMGRGNGSGQGRRTMQGK